MRLGEILLLGAVIGACAFDLYELIAHDGDDGAADTRGQARRHG